MKVEIYFVDILRVCMWEKINIVLSSNIRVIFFVLLG